MEYEHLPEDWPEMYARKGLSECPHQMHWDDTEQQYKCLHGCGYTESTPPE